MTDTPPTLLQSPQIGNLMQASYHIRSSSRDDLALHIRHRLPADGVRKQPTPVLMVHGATLSSLLWDHPMAQWSWMNRLASEGFEVFAVDLRGYGHSSHPDWEQLPPCEPYARASDVLADVKDAIDHILEKTGAEQLDLLGGSWGSVICGMFAAHKRSDRIRKLVLYAPIYCEPDTTSTWWKAAADPSDPTRINPQLGAYRWVSKQELQTRWDSEIPFVDKTRWRPQAVFDALFEASMAQDPDGWQRQPPAFRVPNGTLVDLFEVYSGRSLYQAEQIELPTLLIRADHDQTSTQQGSQQLFSELGAERKRLVQIGNGAHFVILERQAEQIHQEVAHFLAVT